MPCLKIRRLRTHKMRELKRYSLVVSGTLRRLKLHTQLVKLYRKKLYRHVAVEGLCVCPALYAVTVGKFLVDLKKCVKLIVVDMPVLKGTCVNHIVDSGEYLIPLAFVLGNRNGILLCDGRRRRHDSLFAVNPRRDKRWQTARNILALLAQRMERRDSAFCLSRNLGADIPSAETLMLCPILIPHLVDNKPVMLHLHCHVADVLTRKIGIKSCIENDTRAMTLGEYTFGNCSNEKNVIFVNIGWGLGIGMILDGKIYRGKSGFAGELGHMVTFNNEIMCHCGKKGCLETEASGNALHRKLIERLKAGENSILAKKFKSEGDVSLNDIINAVNREDLLCIELVEGIGQVLGRWLAGMINIFNPEKVVIGGNLSMTGDYILQPIKTLVRRYSLNLVNEDTEIVLSQLGDQVGLIGACANARIRAFDNQ